MFILYFRTLYGMLFALIVIISRKLKVIEDSNQMNLCSRPISILALTFSIIGILGYGIFGTYCPSLSYCNEIHPYVVFIPVSVQNTVWKIKDFSASQIFREIYSGGFRTLKTAVFDFLKGSDEYE